MGKIAKGLDGQGVATYPELFPADPIAIGFADHICDNQRGQIPTQITPIKRSA